MEKSLPFEMRKEIIGCDLDDVVRDTITKILEFSNPLFGLNLKKEDIWTYDSWRLWGCTEERSNEIIVKFYDSPYFKDIEACEGAVEGLRALAPYYSPHIITACSTKVQDISRRHLDTYCPEMVLPLHHACSHYFPINGPDPQRTKGEICHALGIEIMIEDNPTFAYACAQRGITTYLMKAPWNKDTPEHPLIIPVNGWDELTERLYKRWTQPLKTVVNVCRDGITLQRA